MDLSNESAMLEALQKLSSVGPKTWQHLRVEVGLASTKAGH